MGKGSKPTIGFWYSMGLHIGWCAGPVDAFLELRGGDRTAWQGEVTGSSVIEIRAANLYGGEKKEGGIVGPLTLMFGEQTQAPNAYLVDQLGPQSAYRGLFTAAFKGRVAALNPYIKAWSGKVRKITAGWRGDVWQPTLARIGDGMNPAHILYRCAIDYRRWDPSQLDLVRMQAAAQTLFDEGMGLCLKWSRTDTLDTFMQQVCSHAGGMWVQDPSTSQYFLKLLRADYDVATLPVLDESFMLSLDEYEQTALDGTVNQISVVYRDQTTNKDVTVTATNLANRAAQGATIAQTNQYAGFPTGDLATRAAVRDVSAASSLLAAGKVTVKRSFGQELKRGDVLVFKNTRLGIAGMPIRVLEVDRGDTTDSKVQIQFAQDQFGLLQTSFISIVTGGWQEPDLSPQPITSQVLFEASYRDLATRIGPADRAQLDVDAAYVGSLAARPSGVPYNYELMTRIAGVGAYGDRGTGDFTPNGLLQDAIGPGETAIVVLSGRNLDLVEVGSEALIDSELVRVDAIDAATGAVTIARGCVDTTPALTHAAGARIWFTDHFTGVDTTEYATGESVEAKLLTRAGTGELDMALAPVSTVTLAQRQARPYPPGNLTVRGSRYPATIEGALTLTWSHRDRLLQADQLVDTLQTDIGPETGTTYTVRVYLGGVLDSTTTGLTGTTATPAVSGDGTVRVDIEADRDGLASWQLLSATFDYYRTPRRVTESGVLRITESGAQRVVES